MFKDAGSSCSCYPRRLSTHCSVLTQLGHFMASVTMLTNTIDTEYKSRPQLAFLHKNNTNKTTMGHTMINPQYQLVLAVQLTEDFLLAAYQRSPLSETISFAEIMADDILKQVFLMEAKYRKPDVSDEELNHEAV